MPRWRSDTQDGMHETRENGQLQGLKGLDTVKKKESWKIAESRSDGYGRVE